MNPRFFRLSHVVSRALLAAAGALAACRVGPNYQRPALDVPATYKSAPTTQAASRPAAVAHLATNWWLLFGDDQLTRLEEAAIRDNPDLKAAMERVAEARAAARQVQSQFYPQITLDPSAVYTRTPLVGGGGAKRTSEQTDVRIPFDLSYEVDLWGQIARSLESADAQTRATADQFAVVMQTLESDVAQDYIALRSLESQDAIYARDVQLFQRQLDLTRQKLQVGLVGNIDVAQTQTELDQLKTQQIDIHRQRADAEHALAILVGKPPSEFSVPTTPVVLIVPAIPPGLPSELLRHRPDVAAAEENLIAANAQVGVAVSNFYPAVRLSGTAGNESIDVRHALDWENTLLSIGPSVSLPIFEGGRLTAALAQARLHYAELVATYRSALLVAFRDVEVGLTDVHLQADALEAQHRAVLSSREYLRLSQLEFDQGLVSTLQLIDADRTLLTNEITEAQLTSNQLVSTVLLIKALGGGWDPQHATSQPAPATQPVAANGAEPAAVR